MPSVAHNACGVRSIWRGRLNTIQPFSFSLAGILVQSRQHDKYVKVVPHQKSASNSNLADRFPPLFTCRSGIVYAMDISQLAPSPASRRLYFLGLLLLWQLCTGAARAATVEPVASALFESAQQQVFQIRVIDLASGDKFSIGSGFGVARDGRIATNFHVVSSFVHEPEKYRLEAVAHDMEVQPVSLVAIDVVHDLAIVTTGKAAERALPVASGELAKGERIYSMGNPLDLGMTIIEGTYNGLVEYSRYRNILFSGSLNSGMSGGPTLNTRGEVVGVNVSKGGEQISFLVPAAHLQALIEKSAAGLAAPDFNVEITAALLADQQQYYTGVLAGFDQRRELGVLEIPDKLTDSLRCWGHSVDREDEYYEAVHRHCRSSDQIFVSDELYVGEFSYDFELISASGLNRFQFYNLLENRFQMKPSRNARDPVLVTPHSCLSDELALDSGSWKISTCFREYRDYPGLYDAAMVMMSTDRPHQAALLKLAASGISSSNALALFRRMAEAIAWKP